MTAKTGISVLIYTKNEEQDLPGCLESLSWCDDIHVFDSMSSDNTAEIAKQYGATVTQRSYADNTLAFGGDEAAHRNWGLQHIPFKYEWIFHLDADERVSAELVMAMRAALSVPNPKQAYRMPRRDYFMGRWLKHVTPSPLHIRLFKIGRVRYERLINPVTLVDGEVGHLDAWLDHFPFSKGMDHWIEKHNKYSASEASQIMQNRSNGTRFDIQKVFFEPDITKRRAQQKEFYYRLPCRPLVMFILLYVARRGFLDGRAGLRYAMLRAMYEYMIVIKSQELIEKNALKE
jgi:glycosyltransferase involved in cell wall biosynthesis